MKKSLKKFGPFVLAIVLAFVVGSLTAGGGDSKPSGGEATKAAEVWTCSMHPQVRQPEFGACPICGMDLIPASDGGGGEDLAPNELLLSERSKALAMIQTTEVRVLTRGGGQIPMTGRVTKNQNETRIVTSWFGGRLDRLRVSSEGEVVKRGRTIADVYSPEIYSAQNDLILGNSQLKQLSSAEPFARTAIEATIEAAKTKLRLLGLKDSEINRMANAKKPWTKVPIRSPFSGTVIKKRVSEGQYVKAGTPLLELSDLGQLWIELDAYADDLPILKVGAKVELTVRSIPNETFTGEVSFIDPLVDQRTRTAVVRVDLDNPGSLKPGQYVTATVESAFDTEQTETVVIPRNAPMYAGRRSLVYVEKKTDSGTIYESRTIELGPVRGDVVAVKNGLLKGERVVSHGAFAIDADLQIKDGLSLMAVPDDANRIEPSDGFRKDLAQLLENYLVVQNALASDDADSAFTGLENLKTVVSTSEPQHDKVLQFWEHPRNALRASLSEIPTSIVEQRETFEALSNTLIQVIELFGNPTSIPIRIAHCPMAFNNKGANWIQESNEIRNAYFGSEMLACGSIERTVAPLNSPKMEPASQPESQ